MRKSLLFIIFLFITNITLQAQDKYIILSGGLTKPLSDFAYSNFDNPDAGFATNGYNFGFELANFLNPWFGLGGSFKFNNSGFNSQKFNDFIDQEYGTEFDTIHLTSGEYNLHNFLVGPYGKINIGGHISILGKAFIGVLSTFRPDQSLVYKRYGDIENSSLYSEGKLTGAFAWNFGGGILVKVSDSFGIIALADYIGANPKFDVFDYQEIAIVKEMQPVRYLNINLGIALTL
ncbi:MAG: hypothetical protein ABFS35_04860 [Bacteroidota bacterium]